MGCNVTLLLILIFLSLAFLRIKSGWKSTRSEIDNEPLLPKWLVRLIWLGSIAFFQAIEFQRYLGGLSYRPFFALFTAVICAAVVWFAVEVRRTLAASGNLAFVLRAGLSLKEDCSNALA
jgi:hypothetical protein